MRGAFGDAPNTINAAWAVAAILAHSRHYDAALTAISAAAGDLGDTTESSESFRTLHLLAAIQSNLKDYEAAQESITRAMTRHDGISPEHLRRAYITQAEIYTDLEKTDEAIESYEQARQANPTEPLRGEFLRDEFDVWNENHKAMELVKEKWTLQERLEWMTRDFSADESHHYDFMIAAIDANEHDFVVEVYQEIIGLLDHFDAGVPLRNSFAYWYHINGDNASIRTQCLAILDSTLNSSNGESYRFTGEAADYAMYCAISRLADTIYEEFRSTADRAEKARLFDEAKGLMDRRLAHAVTLQKSSQVHYKVTLARMARKLGPLHEFEDILNQAFTFTIDALMDDISWNDSWNLELLSSVLSSLDGLEREAQIALSAMFSKVDAKDENTIEHTDGDGDEESTSDQSDEEDEDEDPLPEDEGDLSGNSRFCRGPRCEVSWRAWKGRKIYQCLYCWNMLLCEACFEKRMGYNAGGPIPPGEHFCGKNHRYSGPVDGWKGIKNGMILIEGEEPFAFKDWLKELKEKKWQQAWENFWMG